MAVNVSKLDKYVRQAIEGESTTALHDTGFRVEDSTTGKHYRYVQVGGGVAVAANYPVGMYLASDDPNIVSPDESKCVGTQCCGQGTGAITALSYGWIEERDPAMPTDIRTGTAATIGQGLVWSDDGFLVPLALSSAGGGDAVAVQLETAAVVAVTKIQWM